MPLLHYHLFSTFYIAAFSANNNNTTLLRIWSCLGGSILYYLTDDVEPCEEQSRIAKRARNRDYLWSTAVDWIVVRVQGSLQGPPNQPLSL
jgi:hypothetical protein